ncbi:hypothetical protein SEQ_HALENA_130 [Mycobacterium phage Halena]|uniref:Uncharacterized protein n=5 Tax=Bronvirus TaxID=1623278 RepID=E0YPQ4_9CAUD|nr:hypothetical protein LEBRON_130 [Mycobacterium phage LeBron]YP_010101012.1 hypothetical protein KNU44_gp101 [Mycobacterium phage CicholasNage]AEK07654.1 hypothetical protein UPIE_129 [Mycobacterium phage UPIE]AEZ50795.1 hypothetical protein [Mycobacterium phage Fezzik]AYD82297.1 hypothetical protein SEA_WAMBURGRXPRESS_134 [Mycobacterium phage Wamburgrxpress]QBP29903.1 hypothetical protein SEQ_HALENA_130 [Mycobacterium phage Halena]QOC56783.1 hypothetical protein SEA_TYSON_132 [Mycobacteriu
MSTAIRYHLCDTCACAIVNGDWSSFDLDTDAIDAFLETAGTLAHVGTHAYPGYWDCEACGQVAIGQAHVLETV